ncbi:ATP-binding protein, partial [Escherichia coli]|uniref:ATP-binding protein n=1 Tax=Escherichia coli TaxID=562 RepID=UPI002024D64D
EPNRAWFQVEDDGPGIAPEQRKHLFQPFVRGDSARTSSGTGVGPALVPRIVENHNGVRGLGTRGRGGGCELARGAGWGEGGGGGGGRGGGKGGGGGGGGG